MRRTTLTRSPMKRARPKPTIPAEVRVLLAARSAGWCEARLHGCEGAATDACHRIARKAGGRPLGEDARLSNLWHGCRPCHGWATDRPSEAYELGLALLEHQDPSVEPIAYQNASWVLLDDKGGVTDSTERTR